MRRKEKAERRKQKSKGKSKNTKKLSEKPRHRVIAKSPFDKLRVRSGQAPATKQSLFRAKIASLCSQ
jgi:hypothetical protein